MSDILKYLQLITDLIHQYFWAIMAVTASPLIGYAAIQRVKAYWRKSGKSTDDFVKAFGAGIITTLLTFGFWYEYSGDIVAAVYMAIAIGIGQPFVVRFIFAVLKKRAPQIYQDMAAGTDDTTVFIPRIK